MQLSAIRHISCVWCSFLTQPIHKVIFYRFFMQRYAFLLTWQNKFLHVKNCSYFCSRKRGEIRLPKESAFSLYSANGELGHFTYMMQEFGENDCLRDVYSYPLRYRKWSNSYFLSASFKGVQAQPFGIG